MDGTGNARVGKILKWDTYVTSKINVCMELLKKN